MPLHTADALILRTYKLGEADRIVVFLTRDRGKKRGVARGARRPKSRFTGGLEPLTRARVAYFEKENRELVGLNYVDTQRSPLATVRGESLTYVGYFAELIDQWAPEADPNDKLYRLGVAVADALVDGVLPERLARYLEYWLLRLHGLYPSLVSCHACARGFGPQGAVIGPEHHVFLCRECGPGRSAALSGPSLAFLREAGRVAPAETERLPWSVSVGRELEIAHRLLLTTHLERELRSARVMHELRRVEPDGEGEPSPGDARADVRRDCRAVKDMSRAGGSRT
jgi:DNA repair protein RecO (recombination protein O)